jgi:predicted metal-dependent RNase
MSKRPFAALSGGTPSATAAASAALSAGLPTEVELGGHAKLVLRPLGGGAEVGRSCLLLDYVGAHERVRLLLDCGVLPAFTGRAALPYLDEIDGGPASVDVVVRAAS